MMLQTPTNGRKQVALKDLLTKPEPKKAKTWYEGIQKALDKEDLDYFHQVLANPDEFSGTYIADKMTEAGFPVSSTTINSLRRRING